MCKTIRSYILQRISNVNLTTKISIPPKPLYTNMGQKCLALIAQIDAWIRSLGVRVPLMSRHYLSQKLILSQRHPFLSLNECYFQRTVNLPNVNFITKIYIFETYHLVHRCFLSAKSIIRHFRQSRSFWLRRTLIRYLLSNLCGRNLLNITRTMFRRSTFDNNDRLYPRRKRGTFKLSGK